MTKYIARAKARFYISLRVIFPLLPYLRRLKNRNITHNSKRNVSVLLWSLLFFEIFESNLLMSTWPTPNIIFVCHNTNSTRFTNKRTQLKRVIFLIISSNIIFSIYTAILFIFIILLKGKTSRKKSETSKTKSCRKMMIDTLLLHNKISKCTKIYQNSMLLF